MNREELKQLLIEQNQIKATENIIKRDLETTICNYEQDKFILIISGIRRCGKSTLMEDIRKKYHAQSYYVNFDDERFINFNVDDFKIMHEVLIELYDEIDIFFFDEIQNINGWERFVRRLHDADKKIYITGSNASMLSRELGTHLTGRNINFTLYPFSFKEFLNFKNYQVKTDKMITGIDKSNIKRYFNEFIEKGGFPEFVKTEKVEYLKALYENILYRDIITRYNLKNEKALKEIIYFISSNIGKEVSFNNLKNMTGLTSATTIKEYIEYMENSYLTFLVPRFDISLKKQIYANKKIYLIDTALANVLGFRTSRDYGRILENVVFLELKRRNKEIYYHKRKKECDFVIRDGRYITMAIQVTQNMDDENTKNREIDGLLDAMNSYDLNEGLILTEDEEKEIKINTKTITIKPIWKWLLE
ncbi:MAG: ATP-binding protein [DPANN group archaeon]|nr:ATP-binding protein [DPANN group archaeon]